ncbi:hypothetical protein CLAFUW4_06919 [Fulvia fulva]|nr:hypothetical protein CLAFUR4_06928 [Fulvia fulva]WPV16420.1 hypothetical protein CLAFUW4_06919 [Fulvia fulva]WPV31303.1 hypothetical protein CLAFUW7_06919 [Fulvia fulva]
MPSPTPQVQEQYTAIVSTMYGLSVKPETIGTPLDRYQEKPQKLCMTPVKHEVTSVQTPVTRLPDLAKDHNKTRDVLRQRHATALQAEYSNALTPHTATLYKDYTAVLHAEMYRPDTDEPNWELVMAMEKAIARHE